MLITKMLPSHKTMQLHDIPGRPRAPQVHFLFRTSGFWRTTHWETAMVRFASICSANRSRNASQNDTGKNRSQLAPGVCFNSHSFLVRMLFLSICADPAFFWILSVGRKIHTISTRSLFRIFNKQTERETQSVTPVASDARRPLAK